MDNKTPKDLRSRLSIPWYLKIVLYFLIFFYRLFNRFKYPLIHDPEIETTTVGVYNILRSMRPGIHAQKGSALEAYFKNQHKKVREFLPDGFIPNKQVSMSFSGDLMKNDFIGASKDKFYMNVENYMFENDISVANLESTLTSEHIEQTKYSHKTMPMINATIEDYEALRGHENKKFTIFALPNNHIMDRGMDGWETTTKKLEEDGILHFGTNKTAMAQNTGLFVEKNGIKFGFVGFTYSLNLHKMPDGMPYAVNYIRFHDPKVEPDLSLIETQIRDLKSKGCDIIVLSLHWGIEYEFYPTPRQVRIAHHLAEVGADIILCHHTHCIQPYEFYQTERDLNRMVPIVYSLGNLSANKSNPHIVLSMISRTEFAKGTLNEKEKTYIKSFDLLPVFQHEIVDIEGTRFIQLEILKDQINLKHEDKQYGKYVRKIAEYADQVIGTDWRNNN